MRNENSPNTFLIGSNLIYMRFIIKSLICNFDEGEEKY